MSYIEDQHFKTKTGQPIIIRTALPKDAEFTRKFMIDALQNNNFFIQLPHEFTRSKSDERKILKTRLKSEDEITLMAISNKQIIGLLMVNVSHKSRTLHSAEFGIAVFKELQGLGVGNALMVTLINWANKIPTLERIELRVHAENKPAIALYKKFNFEIEGRRKKAIKYEDNSYMDELLMCHHLN